MTSLLPTDKLSFKRLESAIKRISVSGILLVGVDTLNLSNEFENYLKETHSLKLLDIESEILSTIAYDDSIDKKDFFLVNIFNKENQKEMIKHLQFQRDFIPEKNIKIVVILSNEMLEYLKTNAGDLFSTVKFSYSFVDHSFNFVLEEKDDKLQKAIKEYEDYLKLEVQHDDIIFNLLVKIATEAYKISDFKISLDFYKKALLYTNGKKLLKSEILNHIGLIYYYQSYSQIALKYYKKALKIQRQIKYSIGIANSFRLIGDVYINLNNCKIALKYYNDALILYQKYKDNYGIQSSLNCIGNLYKKLSEYKKALKYYKQALEVKIESGNKIDISLILNNIGSAHQELGELDTALYYYKDSLKIKEKIGNKSGIANSLNNIGTIYQMLGQFEIALDYYSNSLEIKERMGDKAGITRTLYNLESIYSELGDFKSAKENKNYFLKVEKEIGNNFTVANESQNFYSTYQGLKKCSDFETALKYLNDSLKIAKENKYITIEAEVLSDIANLYKEQKNLKEAKKNYLLSRQLYEAMGLTKKVEEINKELDSLSI